MYDSDFQLLLQATGAAIFERIKLAHRWILSIVIGSGRETLRKKNANTSILWRHFGLMEPASSESQRYSHSSSEGENWRIRIRVGQRATGCDLIRISFGFILLLLVICTFLVRHGVFALWILFHQRHNFDEIICRNKKWTNAKMRSWKLSVLLVHSAWRWLWR